MNFQGENKLGFLNYYRTIIRKGRQLLGLLLLLQRADRKGIVSTGDNCSLGKLKGDDKGRDSGVQCPYFKIASVQFQTHL